MADEPNAARDLALEAQLRRLLIADPSCLGKVTGPTVTAIARELTARLPAADDVAAVQAERRASVALLAPALDRLIGADSAAALALEFRRMGEAIESIRLGLHRVGDHTEGQG